MRVAEGRHPVHGIRRALSVLAAFLVGGLLVLLGAQTASAHAALVSTSPQDGAVLERAPTEAVLTFNEPVQLVDGGIRLFVGGANAVVLQAHVSDESVVAVFPADAEDGQYALSYRVVSADGHPITGAILFTIGDAGDADDAGGTDPAQVAAQQDPRSTSLAVKVLTVLQYASLLVFAGLILFDRVVAGRRSRADPRAARVLRGAALGAAAASVLLIPVSALNVTGSPLRAIVTPAVWAPGVLWGPVSGAVLVLVGVAGGCVLATRTPAHRRPDTAVQRRWHALALAPAVLALVAPVLVGHSQLIEPRAVMVVSDLAHLLAGSFWAGGLIGLLLLLTSRADAGGQDDGSAVHAARVVARFSHLAGWTVAILAASGTVMALRIVGSIDVLLGTGYGWTLLTKLGVLAPIVAVAGYNRFRLLPAVAAHPGDHQRWRHLKRTLRTEAALLAVVVTITGVLTNLSPTQDHDEGPPGSSVDAEPVSISAAGQGLQVDGTVAPALVGENDLSFTLSYEDEPVTPEEVTIQMSLPEHDLGPLQVSPEVDPSTGEYTAQLALPVAGEWQLEVVARVSRFAEPIVTVPVTVR